MHKTKEGMRYLIDYKGTNLCSVDANVIALVLNIFLGGEKGINYEIIQTLESHKELFEPYPMLSSPIPYPKQGLKQSFINVLFARRYHSSIWPHLGAIYVTDLLKQAEIDIVHRQYYIERARLHMQGLNECIKYFGFAEVIDPTKRSLYKGQVIPGRQWQSVVVKSENPLLMFAANYLEIFNQSEKLRKKGIFVEF